MTTQPKSRTIRTEKAAETRSRRKANGKYARQEALDGAMKAYFAARTEALATGGKLPVMQTFLDSVNWH